MSVPVGVEVTHEWLKRNSRSLSFLGGSASFLSNLLIPLPTPSWSSSFPVFHFTSGPLSKSRISPLIPLDLQDSSYLPGWEGRQLLSSRKLSPQAPEMQPVAPLHYHGLSLHLSPLLRTPFLANLDRTGLLSNSAMPCPQAAYSYLWI